MKNINKKIWIVLGIILSVCFIFIGTLTVIINGDKICKNTYINDTNIGELTKEQASEKLKIYIMKITSSLNIMIKNLSFWLKKLIFIMI